MAKNPAWSDHVLEEIKDPKLAIEYIKAASAYEDNLSIIEALKNVEKVYGSISNLLSQVE